MNGMTQPPGTRRPIRRPTVLLVCLSRPRERALTAPLRAAGFDVVATSSRAAAIVYGSELAPDLVLTDVSTARVLMTCYPDGARWIRAARKGDLVLLRGAHAHARALPRFVAAVGDAPIAA
jgi:hypothetical protein